MSSPSPTTRRPVVYSRDRARRLRIVLWLTLVLGALVCVLEAGSLGGDVEQRPVRIALVIYAAVIALSGASLWLLVRRDVLTRLVVTVTATFVAIVGVLTVGALVGWLSLLLGLGLLALAVLPDDPGRDQ